MVLEGSRGMKMMEAMEEEPKKILCAGTWHYLALQEEEIIWDKAGESPLER
jgi:hypothetical protein